MSCFPSFSDSRWRCTVDFVFSSTDGEISHEEVKCKDALGAIQSLNLFNDPREYLKDVLLRPCGSLSKTLYPADFMTHRQFECVLECTVESTEGPAFRRCLKKCAEIRGRIHLNALDSRIHKDSEIDS